MLQRIQSVFLLLVIVICIVMMYVPIYEVIHQNLTPADALTSTNPQFTVFSSSILVIINGAIALLAFVSIFLYKNRHLQIRVANLALLIDLIFLGLLFFSADATSTTMNAKVHYLFGSYFPIINAIFLFVAVRFIKRDDDLVRSADRLR